MLPAVGSYRLTGRDAPRLGSVSLDRSTAPDSLVASERTAADSDGHARLWRYAFSKDPARTGLLATDTAGTARAVEAYETEASGVQGVLSRRATRCGTEGAPRCWGVGAGSLSYWEATGEVWSQSGRTLFAVPLRSIDAALD